MTVRKKSRFMDALHSFNQAFVWADEMNSWMDGGRSSKPSIPFHKIKSIATHSQDVWLNAFQILILQYNETLGMRIPLRQRIEYLLNILCQVFSLSGIVMVSVRKQEGLLAWRHQPGYSVKQVKVRMDDAWLAEQLGAPPHQSITLSIPQQGNLVLHLAFEETAETSHLSLAAQELIRRLWLPIVEEALYMTSLQRRISDDQILYQVARMANTIYEKDELIVEYLRFIVPLLGAEQAAIISPSAQNVAIPEWKWIDFSRLPADGDDGQSEGRSCLEGASVVPASVMTILNRRVFYSPAVREFDAFSSVFLALHPHAESCKQAPCTEVPEGSEKENTYFTVAPFFTNALEITPFHQAVNAKQESPTAILLQHKGSWGASQHRILAEANEWLSHALHRAVKLEEMSRQANYDSLTGLLNRRALYTRFCMEAERSMRNGLPMSIAVIDIDYFKRFNDNHGHLIGDTVLRELSDFLSQHIRRSDVLSRFGGEEFVILLPETNSDEAHDLIDRLREAVSARIRVPTADKREFLPITFSAGVSVVNLPKDNRLAAQTFDDPEWKLMMDVSISHADKALYEAKHNGRNQVRCAS